jgi:hypothetical protein
MAAPKGNINAMGNSGGKSLNDRKLAAAVRTLALGKIKRLFEMPVSAMKEEDKQIHDAILLKIAPSLLPRLNEHSGEDGKDLFPTPILANVQPHNGNNQDQAAQEEN